MVNFTHKQACFGIAAAGCGKFQKCIDTLSQPSRCPISITCRRRASRPAASSWTCCGWQHDLLPALANPPFRIPTLPSNQPPTHSQPARHPLLPPPDVLASLAAADSPANPYAGGKGVVLEGAGHDQPPFWIPPSIAIAHHIIRAWVERGGNWFGSQQPPPQQQNLGEEQQQGQRTGVASNL